ncbi:MAG: chemotaxis protein CheW [Desulfobulbaceae bacterium]|nr:chemotaxis protein CheW [Desulfobulbaceae bacterium]
MSDDLSLDDILIMYVQESKEHLENIENDLLNLEREGIDSDDESINKMFRAAHSIKGGSGFWGLDTIKNLSHKTENVLDMIRKRQMEPSPHVVSIILRAFDRLGELLNDPHNSNTMDISAEAADLENLTAGSLPEGEKKSVTRKVVLDHPAVPVEFEVSEFDARIGSQDGRNLYILEFDLLKDVHRRKKSPLDFLNTLNENGTIVDIIYDLSVMGDLDSDTIFSRFPVFVLFSTIIESDLIGTLMGLDPKYVHPVSDEAGNGETDSETQEHASSPKQEPGEDIPRKKQSPDQAPPRSSARGLKVQSDSLRVQVHVLDKLINRAGELVLARNQLLQSFAGGDKSSLKAACQRIDAITSELQESIMLTRMQPINNIFSKFPRVIRDMSQQLGKRIELRIEGREVEVDKTIIEGLSDPLTHLVRNSVDHGIEMPEERQKNGKPETGVISLKAFHESGQIIIEISDDGRGMDGSHIGARALEKGLISAEYLQTMTTDKEKLNLIMLPGFTTAESITDISGRGVGMDVVKTNLDKMGGYLEFDSQPGKGSMVRVKLPLTLAIIPSLLVSSSGERFALPQVNVGELLRIPAAEVREKVKKVSGADVLILRGELIPLLQLNNLLDLQRIYFDPRTGEFRPDRRGKLSDERLLQDTVSCQADAGKGENIPAYSSMPQDRRNHPRSDVNIVVLQAGFLRYALVVDDVHDTVEIVVKPLGRHINQCPFYAGATIMGDGRVALILDVPGLGRLARLKETTDPVRAIQHEAEETGRGTGGVNQSLLIFHNGPGEYCGAPLHQVLRVEQIRVDAIEMTSNRKVIRYRGGVLSVFALEEVAEVEKIAQCSELVVIIFEVAGREVGLLAVPPLDVIEQRLVIDEKTLRQPGICGSTIIGDRTTMIVDIVEFIRTVNPSWFEQSAQARVPGDGVPGKGTILLVEDSTFFRTQVKRFIEDEGFSVREAENGKEAWKMLAGSPGNIEMVITDIEMPEMDGFELLEQIKNDNRFIHLPVIVLTTLAEEAEIARGKNLGAAAYLIKLDRERLVRNIKEIFKENQTYRQQEDPVAGEATNRE